MVEEGESGAAVVRPVENSSAESAAGLLAGAVHPAPGPAREPGEWAGSGRIVPRGPVSLINHRIRPPIRRLTR
jgi:hypothetical protein